MAELENACTALLEKMERELFEIRLDNLEPADWSRQSMPYLQKCLDTLYGLMVKYPFRKRSEEIHFFKHIKTAVMTQLIFMSEVHNAEAFRPSRHKPAEEKDYLAHAAAEVDLFFTKYKGLYAYYKEKQDGCDFVFFVRNVENRFEFRGLPIEIDPVSFYGQKDFSTGLDYMFAKFRAFEMLRDYLENELGALLAVGDLPPDKMEFTGSAADFVQLVEIFKDVGRPIDRNTGEPATDQQVFEFLEQAFNPTLPNGIDFNTLKLISGDSDLAERFADSIDNLYDQWENEEKDIDYNEEKDEEPPSPEK